MVRDDSSRDDNVYYTLTGMDKILRYTKKNYLYIDRYKIDGHTFSMDIEIIVYLRYKIYILLII